MTKMETYDFGDACGPVPAYKHPNGGGWVAETATVEGSARVSDNAWVSGNARVSDNARVSGDAWTRSPAYIQTPATYPVYEATAEIIGIGCELHTPDEWDRDLTKIAKTYNAESDIPYYRAALDTIQQIRALRIEAK